MSFISFNNVTIRIRDKFLFQRTNLQLNKADNLLVVGSNGSGKTTLVKAIAGLLPISQGEIVLDFLSDPLPYPSVHKDKIAYVSFDGHRKIHLENEFKKDLEEFTGKVQQVLNLSTGQTRKYLIEKALAKNPAILILDEPFDGLDLDSRKELKESLEFLAKKVFLILVTHRMDEVIKGIKKAVLIKDGIIEKFGDIGRVLNLYRPYSNHRDSVIPDLIRDPENGAWIPGRDRNDKILIDFQDVSVEFGGKKILEGVDWQVKEGENWAILGKNGAGKSTIVKLVTGENLQVFGNQIKIFGKHRNEIGMDEIQNNISVVSADAGLRIHDYVLVSKIVNSQKIIEKFGLGNLISKKYGELSFGQKRLVLIAKNLAKNPRILILDEPCHGLDSRNRKLVLEEIEKAAQMGVTIVLITHNEDEIIPSINKIMYLKSGRIEKIVNS